MMILENEVLRKTYSSRGMVLGKFSPPHLGHLYLIEFAKNYVDELVVIVETEQSESIPGEYRFDWLSQMYPDIHVVQLKDINPQTPSEHPQFWKIWEDSLKRVLPFQPDFLFASEDYGWKLARLVGAKFVPVDLNRTVIPICGTELRTRPIKNWEFIPRIARPFFAKRVCVFGPESTGKSTLCQKLAKHFATTFVPEYARTFIEVQLPKLDRELRFEDMETIARGQLASEDAIVLNANRVLFCDTDLLATKIWSDWLFANCSKWISETAEQRTYDLYLVTDVDVPWVQDPARYLPRERKSFLQRCLDELQKRNRPHVLLSGDWDARFETAIKQVQSLINS